MTKEEARHLLEGSREDFGGKDPGNATEMLRRVFHAASPHERVIMNDVIREWLNSESETDRFDGAFLTDAFEIVANLDLLRKLSADADVESDLHAEYERARYDRVLQRLLHATQPDYQLIDPALNEWTARHRLHVTTKHHDEDVRSVDVVDSAGREFQIWLQQAAGAVTVHAAARDRRRRFWRSWTSEGVSASALESQLDAALQQIQRWSATLDGRPFDTTPPAGANE
jgi:hypothetical protein